MAPLLLRSTSRIPLIRSISIFSKPTHCHKSLLAIKLQHSGFCEAKGTSNGDSPGFKAWSQISSSLHDELNQFAADNDEDCFINYLQDFGPSDKRKQNKFKCANRTNQADACEEALKESHRLEEEHSNGSCMKKGQPKFIKTRNSDKQEENEMMERIESKSDKQIEIDLTNLDTNSARRLVKSRKSNILRRNLVKKENTNLMRNIILFL